MTREAQRRLRIRLDQELVRGRIEILLMGIVAAPALQLAMRIELDRIPRRGIDNLWSGDRNERNRMIIREVRAERGAAGELRRRVQPTHRDRASRQRCPDRDSAIVAAQTE